MVHRSYSAGVYIKEALERLFNSFLILCLDENFARIFFLQGHGSADLHFELLVLGLVVPVGFVEDGHNHFILFALLASDVEHLKVATRGKHGFVFPSLVYLLLIEAIDLCLIFVLNAIEKDFSMPLIVDLI